MSNINRDYLIILDVKSGEVDSPNIYYFNTDKNTSNLYVQMVIKETNIEATPIDNANNYSIKANILKPNMVGKIVEGNLVNEEKAIYEFKLPADCTDFSGNAKIEFEVYCTIDGVEEIATSFATKFKVHGSVLTEQNKYIEDSSDYPILKELMAEAKELNTQAKELNTDSRNLHEELSGALEAEEQRKVNEASRIANENARETAEQTRQSAEATRIDNENSRIEAEKQREVIKQKLINDIEKLVLDTNKKVSDNLSDQNKKVTKLISDTETKIDTYKTEKNTEIDKDLQVYKENTTDDIKTYLDDYKNEKDNIINSKIEELNRTTYNIEESEKDRVKNETLRQNSESTRSKEFETIKSDYETYKNVMISESNVAALQNQINNNSSQIKEKASKVELETQKARIDLFTSLPEGSTTGDAELIDARIGIDGLIHNNVGSAIRNQISKISNTLEKYVYSDNILNFSYVENLIIENGQEIVSAKWNTTNFIPIIAGEKYTVKNKASRTNYYDINRTYISSDSYDITSFIPPSNARFVRISWYSEDFSNLILVKGDEEERILSLLPANAGNITMQTGKNRFDKNNLLDGNNYISSNGSIVTTNYDIYVSKPFFISRFGNEKYVTISTTGVLKDNIGYRFLDEGLNIITYGMYNNGSAQTIVIPVDAKYMQVTYNCVDGEETSNLQVEFGQKATTYEEFKREFSKEEIEEIVKNILNSFGIRKKVEINPTSNIMDFYTSMLQVFNEGNCDVYIRSGRYEYTNEMIEFIRNEGKRGVPIGNNCKYFFDTNALIYCEYTGSNAQDIGSFFSPLDSWNTAGSWELHNLNLISKNTLYGVHDECSGMPKKYTHIYENCSIVLDNTNASFVAYNRAIGGGLGANGEIIHRHCYYEATSNDRQDVSYHGITTGDNCNIAFTNCYFAHALAIDSPTGDGQKRLIYSGNSALTDIVRNDTDKQDTWNILSYMNEIRKS